MVNITDGGGLYTRVQNRLETARGLLDGLDVSDEVHAAVVRRLDEVRAQSTHDLTMASRRLDGLIDTLESGRAPATDD